jgi:phospholipid/cholesterol/gamma-HCH transport system substrate-binding protein
MESKREQALVGIFVLVVMALLVVTVFFLSGISGGESIHYRVYFKNAGGLAPGTEVRYAGSPPIGRVEKVHPDPADPTRMEVDFHVNRDVPVKTDSLVGIASTSALGENYLEIKPGTPQAAKAPPGSTLKAGGYTSLEDLKAMMADLGPQANKLISDLDARVLEVKETLKRVNDLMNEQNRANISASLSNVRGMLEENRPAIRETMRNLKSSSAKLDKVLDDMKKTMAQANTALAHMDSLITENRPEIRASIQDLRKSLASVASLSDQLDRTLAANSENLDEIIMNLRQISENMRTFTEEIKTRPYTLIRASEPKSHQPGQAPPQ